jgi:hypothetical protein
VKGYEFQVATSIANHVADLPELTDAVAVTPVADASRESLTAAWTLAVQSAGVCGSTVILSLFESCNFKADLAAGLLLLLLFLLLLLILRC